MKLLYIFLWVVLFPTIRHFNSMVLRTNCTMLFMFPQILGSNFSFEDQNYVFIQNKYNFGIDERKHVRVTDLERTVLDSIKDFEKIAGFEELIQCISLVKYLSEEKMLAYLEQYGNQFLYQKAGFILGT